LPKLLTTLGDHIRRTRLERGLLQRDVAKILNVSEDSVTYWENDRAKPQVQHYRSIILFLGYYPFTHETESIAGKLKQLRYCMGLSYEECGEIFAVHATTVWAWELERNTPSPYRQSLILARWESLPEFVTIQTRII